MRPYPGLKKHRLDDERGVSLVETLMLAAVVGVMMMAFADATILIHRTKKQNELINATLSLESEFLGSTSNMRTYSDILLKARMNDGVTLPPIQLRDSQGNALIRLPATPRRRADIRPAVKYFDRKLNSCSSFDGVSCIIKFEASLIMKSGPTDIRATEGNPEWIPRNSPAERASRFPVYAVAYRISVDPNANALRPRGVSHLNPISDADHVWPVPHEPYMPVKQLKTCSGNGVLVGADPDTREPICAEPADLCGDPMSLAKQVVVSGQSIGVECAPWKSVSCPDDYVISEFRPRAFDSEAARPDAGYGQCVYLGADQESGTSQSMGTGSTELNCSDKYDMTGTCSLVAEQITSQCSWRDGAGVTHYQNPNGGTAVMSRTSNGLSCRRVDPTTFCNAPYTGGSWTAEVELNATCTIKPSEKFKPLEAS